MMKKQIKSKQIKHACAHTRMHTHMRAHACMRTQTCVHTHACTRTHAHVHACTCTNEHAHTHTHTNTNTNTNTHSTADCEWQVRVKYIETFEKRVKNSITNENLLHLLCFVLFCLLLKVKRNVIPVA